MQTLRLSVAVLTIIAIISPPAVAALSYETFTNYNQGGQAATGNQQISGQSIYQSDMSTAMRNDGYRENMSSTQQAIDATDMSSRSFVSSQDNYQNINAPIEMFGQQLFRGTFAATSGTSFNGSYVINSGDNIQLRMWGAYQLATTQTVDAQGNIFIPNVGPVRLAGVKNGDLQSLIKNKVAAVYRANVGVYAALEQAQPVKVFVTGFVRQPGYYGGVAADSVLSYLDRAGGVDPNNGSYIDIIIKRRGSVQQRVNLYDFLLAGQLQPFSFEDGDVIVVAPQNKTFHVQGEVANPYRFEFDSNNMTIGRALMVVKPYPTATNVSVTRSQGKAKQTEYYTLAEAQNIPLYDGDQLTVTSERYADSVAIQVVGAHQGNGMMILPYGATLSEVIKQLNPNLLADINNIRLYREEVAKQQKQNINQALDRLEETVFASQSSTKEEASLKQLDSQLFQKFIAKARGVSPDGQVVILPDSWQKVVLKQGDIIDVPVKTSVITVNGEVRTQGALTYKPDMKLGDYIAKSGGFSNNANPDEILVIHPNGESIVATAEYAVQQGDQIMVLPKIKTKYLAVTQGVTQILYQIAVSAKVILDL